MNSKKKQKKFNYHKRFSFKYFIFDFVKWTGFLPTVLFFRPKKYFISDKAKHNQNSGVFIASNHIGFTDPILAHAIFLRKRLWIYALKNLFNTKLKRWFFTRVNAIEVDRENFNLNTYRHTKELIEAGKNICIFWEGHIAHNIGSKIEDTKTGVAFMAMINKAPIIPVMMIPKKHWYERSKMVIGEQIMLSELYSSTPTQKEILLATEYLKEKSNELLEYYNSINQERRQNDKSK